MCTGCSRDQRPERRRAMAVGVGGGDGGGGLIIKNIAPAWSTGMTGEAVQASVAAPCPASADRAMFPCVKPCRYTEASPPRHFSFVPSLYGCKHFCK
jgi:hypothetical protein